MDATIGNVNMVLKNLQRQIGVVKGKTEAGMFVAGLHLKAESQKQAPVMTGNLRASAYVVVSNGKVNNPTPKFRANTTIPMEEDHVRAVKKNAADINFQNEPEARIGYSAVYGLSVHENPRSGKTGGILPSGAQLNAGFTNSGMPSTRIMFASSGKWKFLEDPLKSEAGKILQIIKDRARV